MGELETILDVVRRIHLAGSDPASWPDALKSVTDLVGGHGASFEVQDAHTLAHTQFYSHGLAAVGDYLEHYAPLTKRLPFSMRQASGTVFHEGMFTTEREMDRDPFYMEFLAGYDMRYFLGGTVHSSADTHVLVGVQRSPRQDLPSEHESRLFKLLMPHLAQSLGTMQLLQGSAIARQTLEDALAWLVDGVLVLDRAGTVLHANPAAMAMTSMGALQLRGNQLQFTDADAARRFGDALTRLSATDDPEAGDAEFVVRRAGAPPLSLAVRPVANDHTPAAFAAVYLHDPLHDRTDDARSLRSAFGLTAAEAKLAVALTAGVSPEDYAERERISANTVYTHLRHLKDKCGQSRMVGLLHALNAVTGRARAR